MKTFLCIVAVIYIILLLEKLLCFWEVTVSLAKLNEFISAYKRGVEYMKECNALLRRYSYIKMYVSEYPLDYSQTILQVKHNSERIFNKLLMIQNDKIRDIKQMFNPFYIVREIAIFPSMVLSELGVKLTFSLSVAVNVPFWILAFFIDKLWKIFF